MSRTRNKGRVPDDGKRQGPKGGKASWVRTAGATGSDAMERMERFNVEGAGVDEEEKLVGDMPNEGIELSQLTGRVR